MHSASFSASSPLASLKKNRLPKSSSRIASLGRGDNRGVAVAEAERAAHAPHVEEAVALGIVEVRPLGRALDEEKSEVLDRLDRLRLK